MLNDNQNVMLRCRYPYPHMIIHFVLTVLDGGEESDGSGGIRLHFEFFFLEIFL